MMIRCFGLILAGCIGFATLAGPALASTKDPQQHPGKDQGKIAEEPLPAVEEEAEHNDDMSLGEIPVVTIIDLTPDSARRSLDAYVLLRDKYKDAKLEEYESLQDFVDNDAQGQAFDSDIRQAGFDNVTQWNDTITTVSNAYANIVDDQTVDIQLQIGEINDDVELAQDMKDRIVASLNALIPTENNRKIVQDLIDSPDYGERLKALGTEGE